MASIPTISRRDLLCVRFRRHQLDRPAGTARSRLPDLLDYGVQDTGPDGAAWALSIRGAPPGHDGLVLAWTLRGAPHAYRTVDLADIAVATAPYDEDDAAKRIFDASAPLRKARIPILDAIANWVKRYRYHAGLRHDLAACGPEEVALSILAEIVKERRTPRALPVAPATVSAGEAIDVICGMSVNVATARHRTQHGGREYLFCCAGCREKFLAAPERYAGAGASGR